MFRFNSGGSGAGYTYAWTGPNSFSTSIASLTVTNGATTSNAGTYSLEVTDGNGCVSSLSTTDITVNVLPNVSAGSDASICIGQNTTLSGSGAASYSWDNGITDNTAFTPTSTTTYNVTGTDETDVRIQIRLRLQ